MRSLEETAQGLAELAPKKGRTHAWWAAGLALKSLYDSGEFPEATAFLEKAYNERTNDDD